MKKHLVVLEITSDGSLEDHQIAKAVIKNIQTSKWVGQYDLCNASAETRLVTVGQKEIYDYLH